MAKITWVNKVLGGASPLNQWRVADANETKASVNALYDLLDYKEFIGTSSTNAKLNTFGTLTFTQTGTGAWLSDQVVGDADKVHIFANQPVYSSGIILFTFFIVGGGPNAGKIQLGITKDGIATDQAFPTLHFILFP